MRPWKLFPLKVENFANHFIRLREMREMREEEGRMLQPRAVPERETKV